MEQIFVESRKTYEQGFLLKEQDLRRIVDLIIDQFNKISTNTVSIIFKIKFVNGAIASTDDLEYVLKLENEGSGGIVKLTIEALQADGANTNEIKIDFEKYDPHSYYYEDKPIRYLIKGESRDWVFVTSSLIEERIQKLKKNYLISSPDKIRRLKIYSFPLIAFVFFFIYLLSLQINASKAKTAHLETLKKIEISLSNNVNLNIIDTILKLERSRLIERDSIYGALLISKEFISAVCLILIIVLFFYFYSKLNPPYNFYWGGYIEVFDKKENHRKTLIGIVVLTIVAGILINLLSNYIWEKI